MKKVIKIEGMSCGHCVMHVKEALTEIGGEEINISLEEKTAEVSFNKNIEEKEIVEAIEDIGYDVVLIK